MLPTLTFVLTLATAVSASALLEARVCGDNCARALKNAVKPGSAVASADCSAFLYTTITPSTVTSTTTLTVLTTDTTVVPVTSTETDHDTATEVVPLTESVSVTLAAVVKRATTASSLPVYASACSGAAAYSSACSCLGIFPTTIVAPTPTAAATAWATVVYTSTVTSTIATVTVTQVDATTTTSAVVATQTVTVQPAPTGFILQVSSGSAAGQYVTWNGVHFSFTSTASQAQVLYINPATGYLYDGAANYVAALINSYQYLQFGGLGPNYKPLSCAVDAARALTCESEGGFDMFVNYFGNLAWARPTNNLAGGVVITIRAVPV